MTTELNDFGWCILELMGHRRLAGRVREQLIAGAVVLRIDIPAATPGLDERIDSNRISATQFYGGGALFSLTPTTEEIARAVAMRAQPEPVQRWELPAPKTIRIDDRESTPAPPTDRTEPWIEPEPDHGF